MLGKEVLSRLRPHVYREVLDPVAPKEKHTQHCFIVWMASLLFYRKTSRILWDWEYRSHTHLAILRQQIRFATQCNHTAIGAGERPAKVLFGPNLPNVTKSCCCATGNALNLLGCKPQYASPTFLRTTELVPAIQRQLPYLDSTIFIMESTVLGPRAQRFLGFLCAHSAQGLRINIETAATRLFVLKSNPSMTTPSSRAKLQSWLKTEIEENSEALRRTKRISVSSKPKEPGEITYRVQRARTDIFDAALQEVKCLPRNSDDLDARGRQNCRDAVELIHNVFQFGEVTERRARQQIRAELYSAWIRNSAAQTGRWWWYLLFPRVWPRMLSPFQARIMFEKWSHGFMCSALNRKYRLNANLDPWDI